ncbi:MAG: hypothetical protein KAY37_05200 [Phycisphaerae bacterium]|nr:hypothetical protein [Phycisphaerae bacterium]
MLERVRLGRLRWLAAACVLGVWIAPTLGQDLKWSQPPDPAYPQNVCYGWNEESTFWEWGFTVADDWVCTTNDPIVSVRWWGSFLGWKEAEPPPLEEMPWHFHILIWTDVPAEPGNPDSFSHPGEVIHEILPMDFTYTCEFDGWDYNPLSGEYESRFVFTQDLEEWEWFFQEPTGVDTIYWLSISGCYGAVPPPTDYPWGWTTRPRDPQSMAPDDAVVIIEPTMPWLGMEYVDGFPLEYPEGVSWDVSFELTAQSALPWVKWEQPPDPEWPGLPAHDWDDATGYHGILLADQWQCEGGDVTDLHWYGNYELDYVGMEIRGSGIDYFHLSIHDNVPGDPWCLPGQELWSMDVLFSDLVEIDTGLVNNEGCPIYRYEYVLPWPFQQTQNGIYWFDITAISVDPTDPPHWRWQEAGREMWPILCPAARQYYPGPSMWESIEWANWTYSDLAFDVTSVFYGELYIKWSQPPEPYVPEDAFNGWDEYSRYDMYGDKVTYQLVADDWVCDTEDPVTDLHWWGSFGGWYYPYEPPQMPGSFHIGIWTDVPANPPVEPFSHPGTMIWENYCDNYTLEFVGWDFDPRLVLPAPPPEATFKFTQVLDQSEWFWQDPGEHIYWVSISAVYGIGSPPHSWGWKTRPRDLASPAPDDAVVIRNPTAPSVGDSWIYGWPIEYPAGVSWDVAFELTTTETVQACCFDDGHCEDLLPSVCQAIDGWPQGSGTACVDMVIACCLPDGSCVDADPICCDDLEGWTGYTEYCLGDANANGVDDACEMACCMPDGSCVDTDQPDCFVQGGVPQGPDTLCQNVECPYAKWSQPPTYNQASPALDCFWGWDESSRYGTSQIVADDWFCLDERPITDIHWWGSYWWWDDEFPPYETADIIFHIGIWTDVPAGVTQPFSHPGEMIWEWTVSQGELNERMVGCDFHPDYMDVPETCFQYDFYIPEDEWFYQDGGPTVYWISIAAEYIYGPESERIGYPWGWKTRQPHWNDDAVVILDPTAPNVGDEYVEGFPLEDNTGLSWDMAFVLTTNEDVPQMYPKWSQPTHDGGQGFDAASDLWYHERSVVRIKWEQPPVGGVPCYYGWDEESIYWVPPGQIVADDWLCESDDPVSDVQWWGSYLFWDGYGIPTNAPDMFHVGIWTDVPPEPYPGSFSHPGELLWEYWVDRSELDEMYDGCDDYPPYNLWDSCFVYHLGVPQDVWFYQDPGPQDANIYWLSIAAHYPDGPPCACNGDVDENGVVNAIDSAYVGLNVGCPVGMGDRMCDRCDINCDGVVDQTDEDIVECQIAMGGWPPNKDCCVGTCPYGTGYPWGWKTRPRDPDSLAPDDAVRIYDPTEPTLGGTFELGEPIENEEGSWDTAFVLTSRDKEVNKVVADDFVSDGRPIEALVWWGSYLDELYSPSLVPVEPYVLDGWFISFHHVEPDIPCPPEAIPNVLGVYFAPVDAVEIIGLWMADCFGHGIFIYQVDLDQCCLICSEFDPRPEADPPDPARPGRFLETDGLGYWLDIQAVVGVTWEPPACGFDDRILTEHLPSPNTLDGHFWGWHTSPGPAVPTEEACAGEIVDFSPYPPECWVYGNWSTQPWLCPPPPEPQPVHMAFELLTPEVAICPGDSNCDLVINWRDIDYFVAAMNDNIAAWEAMFLPGTPTCSFWNNDVNGDGTVNWRDIDPFVALMNTTCP